MAHWRNTFRSPRFFILDARAALPIAICLVHVAWYTVLPAVLTLALFFWLERIGLDFPSALRALRSTFAGRIRPPVMPSKMHRGVDYDRREL